MPHPQALLLALREALPQVADTVLAKAGKMYSGAQRSG